MVVAALVATVRTGVRKEAARSEKSWPIFSAAVSANHLIERPPTKVGPITSLLNLAQLVQEGRKSFVFEMCAATDPIYSFSI